MFFLICADVIMSEIQYFVILLPNEYVIIRSVQKIGRVQEWPGCHPTWNSDPAWQHRTFCVSSICHPLSDIQSWVWDLEPFPWLCITMSWSVNQGYSVHIKCRLITHLGDNEQIGNIITHLWGWIAQDLLRASHILPRKRKTVLH